MTPLQALENIIETFWNQDSEDIKTVRKALEALGIIKNHKLLNYVLKNPKCAAMYVLSEEDIQTLKEVLK